MMNNILLCIDSLNSGGAQRQMVLLANELVEKYNITLMYYNDYHFFREELDERINVIYVNGKLNFVVNLIKLIFNLKVDLIYSYLNTTNILIGLTGIISGYRKIILSERGGHLLNSKLRRLLIRIISKRIKYIVANSLYLTQHIKEELNIKNVIYIPNIIDMKVNYSKTKLNKMINIGIIGRFEEEKNQLFPLKQFLDLENNIRGKILFHFAGRNDTLYFKNIILSFIKNRKIQKHCKFYGTLKDIEKFIVDMDFIILPSLRESFSNVLIETYSMSRPVICSNVGDNKFIIDNEVYGFVYNDEKEYIRYFNKLCKMSNKERIKMGKEGRIKIKEKYNLVGINKNLRLLNYILERNNEK